MYITETWGSLSTAQKNLVMYGDDSSSLDHTSKYPIISRLAKDMRNKVYNKEKARDCWLSHADRVAKRYHAEKGNLELPWDKAIPSTDRKAIAKHWEETHRDVVKEVKFDDNGVLITESIVYTPVVKMTEILEAIVDKKPVVVKENFDYLMKIITERLVSSLKEETSKKVFNNTLSPDTEFRLAKGRAEREAMRKQSKIDYNKKCVERGSTPLHKDV